MFLHSWQNPCKCRWRYFTFKKLSLQACNFIINELFHKDLPRILIRVWYHCSRMTRTFCQPLTTNEVSCQSLAVVQYLHPAANSIHDPQFSITRWEVGKGSSNFDSFIIIISVSFWIIYNISTLFLIKFILKWPIKRFPNFQS